MTNPKRPYHHGNLREALIEAGLQLIEERGVKSLTLREIGARLCVSRTAPYRHFPDKAALLGAIREAGFEKFVAALEEARTGAADDFSSRFSAMALAYVRFAARHRAHFEVMFSPDLSAKSEAGARAFGLLEETIREGQRSGYVREGDTVTMARTAWAMTHGISTLNLEPDLSEQGAGTRFVLYCSGLVEAGLAPGTGGEDK